MKTSIKYGYKVNLIESLEDFYSSIKLLGRVVGLDTETDGLDFIEHSIAGVCYGGGAPLQGYYYPIRHTIGKNLPLEPIMEWLNQIYNGTSEQRRKIMLFNKNFDHSMLEKEGLTIPLRGDHHDVQVMVWEATSEKFPSLKEYCKKFFHFDVLEFSDVAGDVGYNFKHTDPAQSYPYAAADPVLTILLGRKMWNDFSFIRRIYPLDNMATEVARRMGQKDIFIDYEILRRSKIAEEKVLRDLYNKCIQLAGCEFNPASNRDKAEVLSRFVTLTQKTKKGAFAVSDEVLSAIDHPLAKALVEYSKQVKYVSSYINALLKYEGKPFRSYMKMVEVPTGRMATGANRGNSFYAAVNIMAIKKTKEIMYLHYDESLPNKYFLNREKEGALGEQEVKCGTREVFIAPPGHYFITSDYNGEEVNLVANFSGETLQLDAIYLDEDIHMTVARKCFGVADKSKRGKMKTCGFLKNYGGEPPTLAKRLNITLQEAKKIFVDYDNTLPFLTRWKNFVIKKARQTGYAFTYYGRPRALWKYYQSSDRGIKAFADRSAVNTLCQGAGGDIMRNLMCKNYLMYEKDPELWDWFKFMWHVHDEENLYARKDRIHDAFLLVKETQPVVHDNWQVPLDCTVGIGDNWGNCLDVEYVSKDGVFLPLKSTFYNIEDYKEARKRANLDPNGPTWKPMCIRNFYKNHPYKVKHVDMFREQLEAKQAMDKYVEEHPECDVYDV